MPDWTKTMEQTFEYYIVDPATWRDMKLLKSVKSCSILIDDSENTRGSATYDIADDVGENYVRAYLKTNQNGFKERFPLGTHLIQTPSTKFDGRASSTTIDAYTPLMELKENLPPLGYTVMKDSNIMENAYMIARERMRAPVVKTINSKTLYTDFVANTDDTWLTYLSDFIANAKYQLDLDEYGRVLFTPIQDSSSLQPVHTYNDDNSSILYPELTINHDIYGIPNVIEVVYSRGGVYYESRAVNDDEDSPVSTVNRGREITKRITDPELAGEPTKEQIDLYAQQALKEASTLEYIISYKHGYCGTRVGDCVRLNYKRAGLDGVTAKIISQTIKCEPGCPVTEKAVYTKKLWR